MKATANIVAGIQSLKMAKEHFEDFQRQYPESKGAKLFGQYIKKIDWVHTDLLSHPFLGDEVRQGIKKEIESDVFAVPAIQEKVSLLDPAKRDFIETLIDAMLKGEEITIVP